jgi:2-enoate reductase
MEFKRLFEPGRIGTLEIPNRIVMAPLVLNYVEYPYQPTKRYADIFEERARGGVGLIITQHIKAEREIDPYPIGYMFPCIDNEYTFRNFVDLAEAAHIHGAKIFPELAPGTGRNADIPMRDKMPPSASEVPLFINPQLKTRALTIDEIQRLVEAYGEAAARVERAGFDGIEVHCFGGYLIDQFLNSIWNKRTDKYGGDLDNRMRFMVECIESAKSRVSSGFPLIARMTCEYGMEGVRSLEETIKIAKRLEELGIKALHLPGGCYDTIEWIIPTMYDPQGCLVSFTQPIKKAVNIPVIVEGRIVEPDFAEKLLEDGKTDFVGLGRALLADPHWPKKVREGRIEEIRKCIFCNECTNTLFDFKHVRCAVNPELGREKEYKIVPAAKPKKVAVIGGGPGGMEAAMVAALRGHQVTLYDKGELLGGAVRAGSSPQFKAPMRALIEWLTAQINRAGVKIKLGKEVTARTIEEAKPDAVVVATGATMALPELEGVKGENVVTAIDVLLGKAKVGKEVVVVGGGYVGCEAALYLAQMGKAVTILMRSPNIAADVGWCERAVLLRLLPQNKVRWLTEVKYDKITKEGVVAADKEGKKQTFKADSVVLASGMQSEDKLYKELQGKVSELYKIGDARKPRKIFNAVHEGFFIGQEI